MIASELITYDIPPLKLSDSGTKALDWMEEFKVNDIPIVDEGSYIGLVQESDILDRNNQDEAISTYNLDYRKPVAHQNQHLFELIALIVENDVDILPVVNQDEKY